MVLNIRMNDIVQPNLLKMEKLKYDELTSSAHDILLLFAYKCWLYRDCTKILTTGELPKMIRFQQGIGTPVKFVEDTKL